MQWLSTVLGGIGLFLLGMVLMTDALKSLAGDSLRTFLARFTGGRFSSVAAGATVTAVIQSSSATTLTTIGFVSAGLLTFQQSIGVVLGANLGTTSTGWLVSLLGLKLSVGKVALPLVGVGALLKLLTRDRLSDLGLALAGFGLIFVGIDTLQVGMQGFSQRFDPSSFPAPTWLGRLLLVAIGVVMTVVMQSSSAAVATTLTALHAGTIDVSQAAAMVIGQNVGTTITAGIASVGASANAKRTALAHVLFNVVTGVVAFLLLPLLVLGIDAAFQRAGITSPALLLAAFHTVFNLLGVALFLPAVGPFARLVSALVPDRGPQLTRYLGPVVAQGPLALDVVGLTAREIVEELLGILKLVLEPKHSPQRVQERLQAVKEAIGVTRDFLGQLRDSPAPGRHASLLHVLDHLERLAEAAGEKTTYRMAREEADVVAATKRLARAVELSATALEEGEPLPAEALGVESRAIAEERRTGRPRLLATAAAGAVTPARGAEILEAVRWIDRLAFHLWRGGHHLFPADPAAISEAILPDEQDEKLEQTAEAEPRAPADR